MSEETVTINKAEYDHLIEKYEWLLCLEAAGVDNWCGYEYAQELMEQEE